jgi:hypothetical protein|tara:strand:+ start:714 stop:1007 length:294 start_codon:yes stop_codon:yes gene_type:complete
LALFEASSLEVGSVVVATTQDKGHDPEFWAKAAADRIVSVGGNCHPLIAQQAEAFKESVQATAVFYIKEAIKSDRTTLIAELEKQGHADMANIIRSL